jgi:FtsZ-interacting cell division protein ZipA
MISLQLGLMIAGVALVVGVILFNWLQERRVRRRIDRAFAKAPARPPAAEPADPPQQRVEPTFASAGADPAFANAPRDPAQGEADAAYEPPLEIQARIASDLDETIAANMPTPLSALPAPVTTKGGTAERGAPHPDPDIECVVTMQPARPVGAGALAGGLHARLGKPVRWFGRRDAAASWQLLRSDTSGEFVEFCACLLLADRAGAASRPLLESFVRLVSDLARGLPAAFVAPDIAAEAARAEALDRICADLDVQIGLTVLKAAPATIAGTRLRGVAEAAGFRLVAGGVFEWVAEETGGVLFALQNHRPEPFTAESLRAMATPGAVFLLDVPRVADPARVFDQMKLVAKRVAQTLEASVVDDNRRLLDDTALNAIRDQVRSTASALREANIEPGSPRALALFGG